MRWSRRKPEGSPQTESMDRHDEEGAYAPPDHARVLARAHLLLAIGVHGEIAAHFRHDQAGADRIREELHQTGAWVEAEDGERALLTRPVAAWSPQDAVNASWRYEGAGVLAWWLGLAEMPAFDTGFSAGGLVSAMTPPQERLTATALPRSPRDARELELLHTQLFTIHWRLVDQRLSPRHLDLRAFAATAWFGPFAVEGIPLAQDDLAVDGAALNIADPDAVRNATSCVVERRLAVQWLLGEDPVYSEGTLDT